MNTVTTDPRHGRNLILQRGLQRWLTRSSVDEILPNLCLGGSHAASSLHVLATHNISFVLTVMSKDLSEEVLQQYREQEIGHMFAKKEDVDVENLLESFGELCQFIEDNLRGVEGRDGKRVLVHCAMGVSRSVTVVLAYVMQRFGISRSEAKRMVRAKRNVANPNSGFYRQLKVWEACKYDIHTVWSINGVKQFKPAYQEWLKDHEELKKKREEERAAERSTDTEEGQTGESQGSP